MNHEQLTEYMTAQVNKLAGESSLYHSISIDATRFANGSVGITFSAYNPVTGHQFARTLDEAIAMVHTLADNRTEAQIKRDAAAKLIAEAETLEAAEALKNQPALL